MSTPQPRFVILAAEYPYLFDEAYAAQMDLPFDEGWDKWSVFQTVPGTKNLKHVKDCDSYEQAEAEIELLTTVLVT